MAKVSVIIPVYNVEDYLKDCLDSVRFQTLKDLEIICINDGSTDSSLSILREYAEKDDRIKILAHDELMNNRGLSASRNLGILRATGDYIAFVDSDDCISSNFFATMYSTAIATEADIVATNIYQYESETNYLNCIVRYNKEVEATSTAEKYKLAHLPEHCYVWNKLYKRQNLQKMGVLFEEGRLYEDIDWSHKVIYYADKVASCPLAKYFYRQRKTSIVAVKSEKWLKDRAKAHRNAIKFVQSIPNSLGNMRNYDWTELTTYKLFGFTILHVRTCGLFKLYYLFGKLLIFEIHKKRNKHDD